MALTVAQQRHIDSLPDPRRNILSTDELRRVEAINERFSRAFRDLQCPAPEPMRGERPRDYELRLTSTLVTEAGHVLAKVTNRSGRNLTDDERRLVKNYDIARSPRTLEVVGIEALAGIASNASRVAERLAREPGVGHLDGTPGLRETKQMVNGHSISTFNGPNTTWLAPHMHVGVTCARFGYQHQSTPRPDITSGRYDTLVRI